jgi:hypothetical protein
VIERRERPSFDDFLSDKEEICNCAVRFGVVVSVPLIDCPRINIG